MGPRALSLLAVVLSAAASTAKPPPCPGGRFVPDAPIVAGSTRSATDVVVLDDTGHVTIGDACGPVRAKVHGTKHGTRIRGTFPRCGDLSHVHLKATVQPGCDQMAGTLTAAKQKPRSRAFQATRATGCGDGLVDAGRGEECESSGDCPGNLPCAGCTCASATTSTSSTTTTTLPADPAQLCVDTINQYRASIGLVPYARWTDEETCASQEAQTDADANTPHSAFPTCGEFAQNECVGWPGPPASVVSPCFQAMWNEGPGDFQTHGHYINMSSTQYTKVACGFIVLPNGDVWFAQDFK